MGHFSSNRIKSKRIGGKNIKPWAFKGTEKICTPLLEKYRWEFEEGEDLNKEICLLYNDMEDNSGAWRILCSNKAIVYQYNSDLFVYSTPRGYKVPQMLIEKYPGCEIFVGGDKDVDLLVPNKYIEEVLVEVKARTRRVGKANPAAIEALKKYREDNKTT